MHSRGNVFILLVIIVLIGAIAYYFVSGATIKVEEASVDTVPEAVQEEQPDNIELVTEEVYSLRSPVNYDTFINTLREALHSDMYDIEHPKSNDPNSIMFKLRSGAYLGILTDENADVAFIQIVVYDEESACEEILEELTIVVLSAFEQNAEFAPARLIHMGLQNQLDSFSEGDGSANQQNDYAQYTLSRKVLDGQVKRLQYSLYGLRSLANADAVAMYDLDKMIQTNLSWDLNFRSVTATATN